jgi:hypothetical protein
VQAAEHAVQAAERAVQVAERAVQAAERAVQAAERAVQAAEHAERGVDKFACALLFLGSLASLTQSWLRHSVRWDVNHCGMGLWLQL